MSKLKGVGHGLPLLLIGLMLKPAPGQQGQGQARRQLVQTTVIELNRFGFFPSQIKHAQGQNFILVRNLTGLQNVSLTLSDGNGKAAKQVVLTRTDAHWRELLNLSPGRYTLTEANNPNWTCTINVQ
jgi:hypothetical protein